jgi:hypothetical protein
VIGPPHHTLPHLYEPTCSRYGFQTDA